jgi:hypothetical protein
LRLDKNGKTFIYTFLELESSSRLPGRDQKVNEMSFLNLLEQKGLSLNNFDKQKFPIIPMDEALLSMDFERKMERAQKEFSEAYQNVIANADILLKR